MLNWQYRMQKRLCRRLAARGLSEFLQFSISQIESMVEMVRGKLTKLQRKMLSAPITLDVHGREVVRGFTNKDLKSMDDFEWMRQLRYYWLTTVCW